MDGDEVEWQEWEFQWDGRSEKGIAMVETRERYRVRYSEQME